MSSPAIQLIVYAFGSDAVFEGQLAGALLSDGFIEADELAR